MPSKQRATRKKTSSAKRGGSHCNRVSPAAPSWQAATSSSRSEVQPQPREGMTRGPRRRVPSPSVVALQNRRFVCREPYRGLSDTSLSSMPVSVSQLTERLWKKAFLAVACMLAESDREEDPARCRPATARSSSTTPRCATVNRPPGWPSPRREARDRNRAGKRRRAGAGDRHSGDGRGRTGRHRRHRIARPARG